ncbi:histidine utilization repressor [Acinetobacter brisouii]
MTNRVSHPQQQAELSPLHDSPLPLYEQVKQLIIKKIQDGIWPANYKIPSEMELVKQLGCSRMTINRALRELTEQRFLTRIQGVGSFVAERQNEAALFQIDNIAKEIESRNHRHRSEIILLEQIRANKEQCLQMQVAIGQKLYHSILIHFENDIPVQLEDRLVNAALIPNYIQQDFTQITPNDYLVKRVPISQGEHIVEAILANPKECKWLEISKTEPCLLLKRRTWTGEHIVSSARLIYPGSRYYLKGKFTPTTRY